MNQFPGLSRTKSIREMIEERWAEIFAPLADKAVADLLRTAARSADSGDLDAKLHAMLLREAADRLDIIPPPNRICRHCGIPESRWPNTCSAAIGGHDPR
jgi:hypothetical protein